MPFSIKLDLTLSAPTKYKSVFSAIHSLWVQISVIHVKSGIEEALSDLYPEIYFEHIKVYECYFHGGSVK